MKKLEKDRAAVMPCEGGFEALQCVLKGEYTEESTGARTIRQTGGKDRHSKVFTARGPRDRRVRLSVATAIRFYDLQDRLGFEQPSKAVEWLLLNCQKSIQALPRIAASLYPVRVASLSDQPPSYIAPGHDKGQEHCKSHEDKNIHHQKGKIIDAVMHENGGRNFYRYDYPTTHRYASPLHTMGATFAIRSGDQFIEDSLEKNISPFSNLSSGLGSSNHPSICSFSDQCAQPPCRPTLAEAIPIQAIYKASPASMHQSSTSLAPIAEPTVHINKRQKMQHCIRDQEEDASRFVLSNNMSSAIDKSLGNKTGLCNQLKCSSFGQEPSNEEDSFVCMSKLSLESQLHSEGMQQITKLPFPGIYMPNQYVDVTQPLSAAQSSQLANNTLIQGVPNNNLSNRKAEYIHGQVCTSNTSNIVNDTMQFYNKMALQQQIDELVCNNAYGSPSSSESTSMNPLPAAYSIAGSSNINNNMVSNQKLSAANILYMSSWDPARGLQ